LQLLIAENCKIGDMVYHICVAVDISDGLDAIALSTETGIPPDIRS
jgi:hypothetical protein